MKKRRKYKTDSEAGIRPINVIDKLPSCELTDEEFIKQFYHRFGATALVVAYCDEEGEKHLFGRLKYGRNPGYWYRQLLHVVDAHIPTIMPRESIVEWIESSEKKLEEGSLDDALTTLKSIKDCILEDMELHMMKYDLNS